MDGHGIHSPFVFDLVTRVLTGEADRNIVRSVESIRKKLEHDHKLIEMYDLGIGSQVPVRNLRKISDIVRSSSVPRKYGLLLAKLSSESGKPVIIEFGTSFGISTMYMAASCPESSVFTMEGCPAVAELALRNFEEAGLHNIRLLTGSFEESLPAIINQNVSPGLVFIDGNHRKEALIEYFGQIAEISDYKTVVVIDDIYYSVEMQEAWKAIKQNDKISLTIDLFRMGIVFFRRGIARTDYIIRY